MAVLNGERMHDTMERLLPGARSAALLWQGAAVLGGAALLILVKAGQRPLHDPAVVCHILTS